MRLLLIEDQKELASALAAALARLDTVLDHAPNLMEGEEAARSRTHDAIILDRSLPDGEGLAHIPALRRAAPGVPIIVLTAHNEMADRIQGLDSGADDYLGKPFHVDELMARLRAVLRRPAAMASETVSLGKLEFDPLTLELTARGRPLDLPRRELLLLSALLKRPGKTSQRASLEEALYGFDDEIQSNALDAHASRLRRKLTEAGAGVEIHAVRGVGYLIRAADG